MKKNASTFMKDLLWYYISQNKSELTFNEKIPRRNDWKVFMKGPNWKESVLIGFLDIP